MRRAATAVLVPVLVPLLLVPAPAAVAAPTTCAPGPVELAGVGGAVIVAGQEHVQGYVLRRRLGGGASCVVPGATVQLLARTTGSSTTAVARTATTDGEGRVQFRVRPPYTVVLSARSVAGEGFEAVSSAQAVVDVSTRVTLARRSAGACRAAVGGRTYPAKPGTLVHVQSDPGSPENEEVGRFGVRADGTWSGTVPVPCGSDGSRLLAWIQQTARNGYGDSFRPGPLAARTTTCGQALASSGEVAALTHAFEPFNTTTAPYGRWWGERVVSNRTDRTLTFDAYSTDTYQLARRGSTSLVGGSGFSDAIAVSEHVLAPGAELREVVSLSSGNCYAPVPPGYAALASSPGPAFSAGTAVAGSTVLRTDKGTSVSARVPLTVS